jgi:hypothetical protein
MQHRRPTGDEWWRPMPSGASVDALGVLAARCVRAVGDGFVHDTLLLLKFHKMRSPEESGVLSAH